MLEKLTEINPNLFTKVGQAITSLGFPIEYSEIEKFTNTNSPEEATHYLVVAKRCCASLGSENKVNVYIEYLSRK